jgi:HlyD family secretion protein
MKNRLLAGMLIAAVVLAGCSQKPATAPAALATSVQVAPSKQTDLRQALTYTGDVKPVSQIDVLPKGSGRITALSVAVGSKVQAGDVIAQLEHTTLDLALQQAQAQLLTAQAHLDTVKAGPRAENVAQAQANVDVAQSRLQTLLNGPKAAAVAQAQAAVDQAQQHLNSVKSGSRAESISQAQANLSAAQARLDALKNGPRPEVIAQLQLAVSQAKNALFAAQASRDGTCGSKFTPGYACQAANAQVDAAQTAVDQANQALKTQTAPPTATDLQQAQAAVDQAQAALQLAQKPYTAEDLKTAQAQVDQALQGLALVKQPYTDEDIRQAKDAVDVAQQQLALAKAPYTDQDLETAQAGVAQAQAGVDQAKQAVADATITAPIAGVITQKLLDVGAMAAPTQPIVSIATSDVKVTVAAEDTQVANLKIGQPCTIAGPALGDQVVTAKVTNISPSGDAKSRTFAVEVTPDATNASLLSGMFVQVTLNAVEHKGVVAVPTQALVERGGKYFVYVVNQNIAHLTPVTVGLADTSQTEVNGIPAGTNVVIQGQDQLTDGDHVAVAPAG